MGEMEGLREGDREIEREGKRQSDKKIECMCVMGERYLKAITL